MANKRRGRSRGQGVSSKADEAKLPDRRPGPPQQVYDPRNVPNNPQALGFYQVVEEHESYSGPIPHPDLLRKFNEIIPNGAERILAMAEQQQDHRQDLERIAIAGGSRRSWAGLAAGLIVCLAFLFVSAKLIEDGFGPYGVALGTIDLAGLVAVFVTATTSQRQERQAKRPG